MKHIITIALTLLCLLGVCSCDSGQPTPSSSSAETITAASHGTTTQPPTAAPTQTQTAEPDDGIDDYTPNFPSQIYEYVASKEESLEEIVDELVKLYLKDMMTQRDNKSFTITEYRNLTVEIKTDKDRYEDTPESAYNYNPRQWRCYVGFEYRWEGIVSPEGSPLGDGAWIAGGYFDGFLIENQGYTFRMACPVGLNAYNLFPEEDTAS